MSFSYSNYIINPPPPRIRKNACCWIGHFPRVQQEGLPWRKRFQGLNGSIVDFDIVLCIEKSNVRYNATVRLRGAS